MIIQLDDLPDCASCPDLTKRVKGRAIDLDGPGVCSPMKGLQEWARAAAEAALLAAEQFQEALLAALTDLWEPVTELIQELAEAAESCDAEQEDDRHDGAVLILVIWLPPAPQLRHLYGQGVDYGGPDPRPGLIRPADDGPRRAETGIHTEEENAA